MSESRGDGSLRGAALLEWLSEATGVRAIGADPERETLAAVLRRLFAAAIATDARSISSRHLRDLDLITEELSVETAHSDCAIEMEDGRLETFSMGTHPIVGSANPFAPPVILEIRNGEVFGTVNFPSQWEGYPGSVFGGFIAAAFDAVLGVAAATVGGAVMARELHTTFERAMPTNAPGLFQATATRGADRCVHASGSLSLDGSVRATARAEFRSMGSPPEVVAP